ECAAAVIAGQHRTANLVVVLHVGEAAREPLVEIGAPRVARLRAAQRDDPDAISLLIDDGHVSLLAGGRGTRGGRRSPPFPPSSRNPGVPGTPARDGWRSSRLPVRRDEPSAAAGRARRAPTAPSGRRRRRTPRSD